MTTKIEATPADLRLELTAKIATWADVELLGSKNVAELLIRARRFEKELTDGIHFYHERRKFFAGKSGSYFAEKAKDFENPTLPQIEMRQGLVGMVPIPTDDASLARKVGTTDFNICGWCSHADESMGGGQQWEGKVTSYCSLLDEDQESVFNAKCRLHQKSAEYFEGRVQKIDGKMKESLARREKLRAAIHILLELKKKDLPNKPILPELREYDYASPGDELVVNMATTIEREKDMKLLVKKDEWMPATAIDPKDFPKGTYVSDGHIYYRSAIKWSEPDADDETNDGFIGGVNQTFPEAMLRSEFEYLRRGFNEDAPFMTIWLDSLRKKVASRFRKVNVEQLVHNLEHGTLLAA
ncbi:MAG: hypothetical protein V4436_03230 [Patescibacteria group bacterium]